MISHIRIAEAIRSRIGTVQPRIALVLGSGSSTVADIIEQPRIFTYDELEGFPRSTVPGHDGRLLIGPNDDSIGPRFVDMSDAWSAELRGRIQRVAHEVAIDLREGVYLMAPGPKYEPWRFSVVTLWVCRQCRSAWLPGIAECKYWVCH